MTTVLDFGSSGLQQRNTMRSTVGSVRELTLNDSKILGHTPRRLEKSGPPQQYATRAFKTQLSTWTPVVHKPSNETIFKERKDLVTHWFDLWTDSQRKRFLDAMLRLCKRSQKIFIWNWFDEHVPLRHVDFTKVLPRCLALRVFSFLDPRSLSRASLVCWHWKFLTEQDEMWAPKCIRFGWFLPYEAADNEYGAWKRHYVACIHSLDLEGPSSKPLEDEGEANLMYGSMGDGADKLKRHRRKRLDDEERTLVLQTRGPWMPPDRTPRDLERSAEAIYNELNPNDPYLDPSQLIVHNKFGLVKRNLTTSQSLDFPLSSLGLQTEERKAQHRALEKIAAKMAQLKDGDDAGLQHAGHRATLNEAMELETFEEKRLIELVQQPWEAPHKANSTYRMNLSGGGATYPWPAKQMASNRRSKSFPLQENPRVIFLSSRIPAADVLVDAVLFGVVPIVYEYEGTTIEALVAQLEGVLQGRRAQSIGVFTHCEANQGELRLVHGSTIDVDNLDTPEFVTFFQQLTSHVLPPDQKGHIDMFVPLASTESGGEMLVQLGVLTGVSFTSPTGILGNYNHVNSDWLVSPEHQDIPTQYFCSSKLNVWANTADQVHEACRVTKQVVGRYFEQKHRDVVSQLTGQIIFDAMGQVDIVGVKSVTEALVDGLVELGEQQNVKPLEFLGRFLLEKAGMKDVNILTGGSFKQKPGDTLSATATLSAQTLTAQMLRLDERFDESLQNSDCTEDPDGEVANITGKEKKDKEKEVEGDGERDIEEEKDGPAEKKKVRMEEDGDLHISLSEEDEVEDRPLTARFTSRRSAHRLSAEDLAHHPDKRSAIAREILSSEEDYMDTLRIIKDVFRAPLKSALASNRAMMSAQNMQVVFTDPVQLLELSHNLVRDLRQRITDWGPQQCIGDIFVKFTSRLKVYSNFLNNYPLILKTIERCTEHQPTFRAFLRRRERQPQSKMLTLPELFLAATRRIKEYVTLLTWFRMATPPDHADRNDIQNAIKAFTKLDALIKQCKKRGERERELIAIQKTILNCPLLLEANRFFLKQQDVAHLRPPSSDAIALEFRVYHHIEMLGLYLFNDSLVVTRRTTRNFPFERSVEHVYKFETCMSLTRLRVQDIPDSKYIRNALRIYTPKRDWICAMDCYEDKFNWMSLLEKTIGAYLGD